MSSSVELNCVFHSRQEKDERLLESYIQTVVVSLQFAAEAWRHRRIYFHQFRKVGDTSLVDPNHDNGCLAPVHR